MPPGSFRSVKKPTRMMPSTGRPIQAASQIWPAGRIEMKLSEMPARVPSRAARGVILRMNGPMKAPISTMTPMMKAQASPACPGPDRVAGASGRSAA